MTAWFVVDKTLIVELSRASAAFIEDDFLNTM